MASMGCSVVGGSKIQPNDSNHEEIMIQNTSTHFMFPVSRCIHISHWLDEDVSQERMHGAPRDNYTLWIIKKQIIYSYMNKQSGTAQTWIADDSVNMRIPLNFNFIHVWPEAAVGPQNSKNPNKHYLFVGHNSQKRCPRKWMSNFQEEEKLSLTGYVSLHSTFVFFVVLLDVN